MSAKVAMNLVFSKGLKSTCKVHGDFQSQISNMFSISGCQIDDSLFLSGLGFTKLRSQVVEMFK